MLNVLCHFIEIMESLNLNNFTLTHEQDARSRGRISETKMSSIPSEQTAKANDYDSYLRKVNARQIYDTRFERRCMKMSKKTLTKKNKKNLDFELQMFSTAEAAVVGVGVIGSYYAAQAAPAVMATIQGIISSFNGLMDATTRTMDKATESLDSIKNIATRAMEISACLKDLVVAGLNVFLCKPGMRVWSLILNFSAVITRYYNVDFMNFVNTYFDRNQNELNLEIGIDEVAKMLDTYQDGLRILSVSVLGILSLLFLRTLPGKDTIEQLIVRLGSLGRASTGIKSLWNDAGKIFDDILNFFRVKVLGVAKVEEAEAYIQGYSVWMNQVQALTYRIGNYKMEDEIYNDEEAVHMVEQLYRDSLRIANEISEKKLPEQFRLSFLSHQKYISDVFKKVDTSGIFGDKPRTEPAVICLVGESGVGKSGMAWPLSIDLNAMFCTSDDEASDFAKQVYFRNTEQEFWDNYRQQNIVVYDDFGQVKDGEATPNPEFMEVIRSANLAPFPLHMAHLEDKRKTKFTSKILLLTCNVLAQRINSLNYPDAFYRRIDVCGRVYNAKEYSKVVNGNKNRLDSEFVEQRTGLAMSTIPYLIDLIEPETGSVLISALSYEEFLRVCADVTKSKFERSLKLTKELTGYGSNARARISNILSDPQFEGTTKTFQRCKRADLPMNEPKPEKPSTSAPVPAVAVRPGWEQSPCLVSIGGFTWRMKRMEFQQKIRLFMAKPEVSLIPSEMFDLCTKSRVELFDVINHNFEYLELFLDDKYPRKVFEHNMMTIAQPNNFLMYKAAVLAGTIRTPDDLIDFPINNLRFEDEGRSDSPFDSGTDASSDEEFEVQGGLGSLKEYYDTMMFNIKSCGKWVKRFATNPEDWKEMYSCQMIAPILYKSRMITQKSESEIRAIVEVGLFEGTVEYQVSEASDYWRQVKRTLRSTTKAYLAQIKDIVERHPYMAIAGVLTTVVGLIVAAKLLFSEGEAILPRVDNGILYDSHAAYGYVKIHVNSKLEKHQKYYIELRNKVSLDRLKQQIIEKGCAVIVNCKWENYAETPEANTIRSNYYARVNMTLESREIMTRNKPTMAFMESRETVTANKPKQVFVESRETVTRSKPSMAFMEYYIPEEQPAMQMWVDKSANELIQNKILKNQYLMTFFDMDLNVRGSINVLFIRGKIALSSHHLEPVLRKSVVVTLENAFGVKYEFPTKEIKVHQLVNGIGETLEAALVVFPKSMTMHADIVKHFADSEALNKTTNTKAILSTMRQMGSVMPMLHNVMATATDKIIQSADRYGNAIVIRRCVKYAAQTTAGDCGSPIVVDDTRVTKKIIGIHNGAYKDGRAIGESITIASIQRALSEVDLHLQIALDEDEIPDLELYKGDLPTDKIFNALDYFDIPSDKFFPVGHATTNLQEPASTSLRPSLIHGKVTKPITKPAYLQNIVVDGKMVDIRKKNLKKAAMDTPYIPTTLVKAASESVKAKLFANKRKELCRVLTPTEAVEGVQGERYVDPVSRKTSPGFPWVLERKNGHAGKTQWLGENETYKIDADLVKAMNARIAKAKKGQRSVTVWRDTLKDERRPIAKVDEGKTRVFAAGPMDFTLVCRMYFLGFVSNIMENRVENEQSLGTNPFSVDWETTAKKLGVHGKHVIAGDFSSFDGTLNNCILTQMCADINEWYDDGPENALIRETLWAEIYSSLHRCRDVYYSWSHSQPSGCPLTTCLNSYYNSVSMRIVYMLCAKEAGLSSSMVGFENNVSMVSYGDDNVINISDTIIDWFNQNTITEGYAKIGMTYTDEAKTMGVMEPFRTLEQVKYLKRSFIYDDENKIWLAPLELETVLEMANWVRDSTDVLAATHVNFQNAIRELSMHPEETFDFWCSKLIAAFYKATNTYPIVDSYESMREDLRREYRNF